MALQAIALFVLIWLNDTSLADAQKTTKASCVEWQTQSLYRAYAYRHIVKIRNTCERKLRCDIKASSNPKIKRITLASQEHKDVVVHGASPARTFSVTVECK